MKAKKVLLFIILFLVVGFAAYTTTLYINGNVSISETKCDAVFTSASLDGDKITNVRLSDDKRTITFESPKKFKKVGDRVLLDFDVQNLMKDET